MGFDGSLHQTMTVWRNPFAFSTLIACCCIDLVVCGKTPVHVTRIAQQRASNSNAYTPITTEVAALRSPVTKSGLTDEQRLLRHLLQGYEKNVRPVRNASTPIVVRLGIALTHLFDLDERNQVFTTMVWLNQEWDDELLTWDPADYHGLTVLVVPCELLWLPDMILYNNADDYTNGYMKSRALVRHNGTVFWPPPTKMRSTCKVNIQYFPFDTQECQMKFGSWVYNGLQVDVVVQTGNVDLKNYVKNGEWELQSVTVERHVTFYTSCCPEPFPDVTFRIVIRRRGLYYAYNTLFPCIMMSVLTLLVFVLPPDSGEKIALGITVLLAFSVIMLSVTEKLPETSDSIPLIGIYLTTVMTMASVSVIMTVVVINIDWRQPEKHPLSDWVKRVILGKLAHALRVDTNYNPGHLGPSSENEEDNAGRVSVRLCHDAEIVNDDGLPVRKEWRQVAQVMDRCLFWIFCAATVLSTVILLVILPAIGDRNIGVPVEDTL